MPVTSWKYPTAAVNTDDDGSGWLDISNVYTENGTATSCALLKDGESDYLDVYDFDFSVPSTATIVGVEVESDKYASVADAVYDSEVYLIHSSSVISGCDNKAQSANYWNQNSYETFSYGGSSDDWGCSLTPSIINSSSFGVRTKAFNDSGSSSGGYIDFYAIRVTYSVASDAERSISISAAIPVSAERSISVFVANTEIDDERSLSVVAKASASSSRSISVQASASSSSERGLSVVSAVLADGERSISVRAAGSVGAERSLLVVAKIKGYGSGYERTPYADDRRVANIDMSLHVQTDVPSGETGRAFDRTNPYRYSRERATQGTGTVLVPPFENIYIEAREFDPPDPPEGFSVIWQSTGEGTGDAGDILVKITAGGETKTATLVDFSSL